MADYCDFNYKYSFKSIMLTSYACMLIQQKGKDCYGIMNSLMMYANLLLYQCKYDGKSDVVMDGWTIAVVTVHGKPYCIL